MNNRRTLIQLAAGGALSWGLGARAQGYPDRAIKIVQGFAPGGNADTIARLVGAGMQSGLKQSVVVDAVTGAGGVIASSAVARAKPDGYTLLLATGGHVVAAAMRAQSPYRPVDDYEAISTITFFPFLIVTRADSKFRSLSEVLAAARAAPGSIAYGSAGVGTTHHLAGELLSRTAGVDLLHVAYRGDAASMTSLLAGDVPVVIAPPTAVIGQIQAGKVRALATTGPQRWSGLPDVPTAEEQGVKGYDVRSWAGLLAPKGTPADIIARLNAQVREAVKPESVRTRLAEMGGEVRAGSPQEMISMMMADYLKWSRVIAAAKIPLR